MFVQEMSVMAEECEEVAERRGGGEVSVAPMLDVIESTV